MTRWSAALLALWGCSAFAAETPESLVQKLGSPRYAEREAASQELLKLGKAALPAVKAAAATSPNAELRERALALLEPLSLTEDSSKLLAAKPVKLDYKAVPLASAIADFKTKTGIPLQLVPGKVADATRPVTLAGEYVPWEALEHLLNAAGLKEDHRSELPLGKDASQTQQFEGFRSRYYGQETAPYYSVANAPILIVDGKSDNLPAVRTGGVRITVLPPAFPANRVVRGAGRVIFHLDAAPVPATGWHGANSVRITAAEDEDGRPVFADLKLANDAMAYNPYDPWNNGWGWRGRRVFWGGGMAMFDDGYGMSGASPNANPRLVAVALRTNDRTLTRLRKFEGVVLGDVHTPNVPIITLENIEKAIGTAHAGPQQSTLQVNEAKKHDNGTYTLKIRHEALTQWAIQMMRGGGNGLMSFNDNPGEIINRIKYYDAEGKEVKNPGQESTSYSGDGFRQSVEMTLRFPKTSKPPVKLVVTGTRITPVEVPFQLTNVSVP